MLLIEFFLFVIIRNIVNYVVIPLARLYGVKWIEKHFDDNNKQLSLSETSHVVSDDKKSTLVLVGRVLFLCSNALELFLVVAYIIA